MIKLRKDIKSIIVFVIILTILLSLSGCERQNEQNNKKTSSKTENINNEISIGDYVAYDEGVGNSIEDFNLETDGTLKWRVFSIENGNINLICDTSIIIGEYEKIEKLDERCSIFGKGEGAESARSITLDDIKKYVDFDENTDEEYIIPFDYISDNSVEYKMLFKDENNTYKQYFINSEKYNCFGNSDISAFSISYADFCSYKAILPIVTLKSDVKITEKDENGVWQIENTDKNYDEDYIEISSESDFLKLTEEDADLTANYKLTTDLDLSEIKDYKPIGNSYPPFEGIFDGGNHTISGLNINTNNSLMDGIGLFGETENAIIKNLRIENLNITSSQDNSGLYFGGLIGRAVETKIINCQVSGNINCQNEDDNKQIGMIIGMCQDSEVYDSIVSGEINSNYIYVAGGLIGESRTSLIVENCISDVDLISENGSKSAEIGGFIGSIAGGTGIRKCGCLGNINFNFNNEGYDWVNYVSGFVNTMDDNYTHVVLSRSIVQCYAKTNINVANCKGYISGFIGETRKLQVIDCYYKGNIKLEGENGKICTFKGSYNANDVYLEQNCYTAAETNGELVKDRIKAQGSLYYNKDKTSEFSSESNGAIGLTSQEFESKDYFETFDFENVWDWDEDEKRPVLQWEKK